MATVHKQLDAALARHQAALAALHVISLRRDAMVRAAMPRIDKVREINKEIAAKRKEVQAAREAVVRLHPRSK